MGCLQCDDAGCAHCACRSCGRLRKRVAELEDEQQMLLLDAARTDSLCHGYTSDLAEAQARIAELEAEQHGFDADDWRGREDDPIGYRAITVGAFLRATDAFNGQGGTCDDERALLRLGQRAVDYYIDTGLCVFCDADDVECVPHEDCEVGAASGVVVDDARRERKRRERKAVAAALFGCKEK